MNIPYDILYSICTFLNYSEIIFFCSTNKRYYNDYKKKDNLYKNQLSLFEKYSCPLYAINKNDQLKLYYFTQSIKNSSTDYKINEFIKYLRENNVLDKKGITPYINNKIIEIEFPMSKSWTFHRHDCHIPHDFDILLYTDIITTNTNFELYMDIAYIEINGQKKYSATECIKILNENDQSIYRLCWNINDIKTSPNYDHNALWLLLNQQKYYKIRFIINFFGNIDCRLKITGINHNSVSKYNEHLIFIRPNIKYDYRDTCTQLIDWYMGGIIRYM
jgi:hypothetical protein